MSIEVKIIWKAPKPCEILMNTFSVPGNGAMAWPERTDNPVKQNRHLNKYLKNNFDKMWFYEIGI